MNHVYEIDGVVPVIHPSAFVHPSAVLIGDVIVGPRCYIGPGAALRGDFGRVRVLAGANVQDTCVLHGTHDGYTVVDVDGHIGHGAILHGCRIGRNTLVGMNAVVMDEAVVGEDSIVAAATFVRARMVIPAGHLVVGAPGRIVRALTADEVRSKSEGTRQYQALAVRSLETMRATRALTEVPPGRGDSWPAPDQS